MSDTKKKPKTKSKKELKAVDQVRLVAKIAKDLLTELKVKTKLEVKKDEEGAILVQLETNEPGVLIGYHGETLAALQLILGMMVYRKQGEWSKVLVNVNDYRERREESLEKMALSAAQKAKFSQEPQSLPPMPPSERRIIHLALSEDEEVETESEGEDHNRRVVVKPKA